jgi:serine/threonine-protein kinase
MSKTGQLLSIPKVLSIIARVAEALVYAHKLNVLHRDIKPASIIYDLETDSVKVTGFGIARITDASKTNTGLVLGTPSYMSPEQIAGKKVDGRSDLYSLGAMLFQTLAGVLPFRGNSMAELMDKIAIETAPDVRIIRAELPEKLAAIVALSVSKMPETRYQDGAQFAADLRAMAGELAGLTNMAGALPLVASHGDVFNDATGSDSTVTQPLTVYEETRAMQAEALAGDKANAMGTRVTLPNLSHSNNPSHSSISINLKEEVKR